MPGQTPKPATNGANPLRIWLKGWRTPQTAFYFKKYGEKALTEFNVAHDSVIIRAFQMNKHVSIDFADETTARTFLSCFRQSPTVALDRRSGAALKIYATPDRTLEDRKKLGKLSPLFDLVKPRLIANNKWDEAVYRLGTHASSQTFYVSTVAPSDDLWSLFIVKGGIITPSLADLALWGISATEADEIVLAASTA
jgi:hypothetical protein